MKTLQIPVDSETLSNGLRVVISPDRSAPVATVGVYYQIGFRLEPEGRKYTPHVTLARLRDASSRDVADYLAARAHYRSASFAASRFVLFSSRSSVGGGPYVVEADYPLTAPELRLAPSY